MTIADLARRAAKLAIDNSPNILTVVAVTGTITTAYLTGKASFQAADIIRLKEGLDDKRGVPQGTPKEVMKDRIELVWKLYIPPAVMLSATVASIVAANRVSAARAAGIATAYGLLERNFADQKDKIIEKLGERKAEALQDELAQDRVNATYNDDVTILGLPAGEVCLELFGNQYFHSSVEDIRGAENSLNATIIHNGYATLADFYRLLGIEVASFSEGIGWNSDRLMRLKFSSTLIHETKPCITIDFVNEPLPDYGRFR